MEKREVASKIRQFIKIEILRGQSDDLADSTPLLELGILDSLSMVKIISYLEKEFKIQIPQESVLPKNFNNVQNLTEMVIGLAKNFPVKTKKAG